MADLPREARLDRLRSDLRELRFVEHTVTHRLADLLAFVAAIRTRIG